MDSIQLREKKRHFLLLFLQMKCFNMFVCLVVIGYTTIGKFIQNQAKRWLLPHTFAVSH